MIFCIYYYYKKNWCLFKEVHWNVKVLLKPLNTLRNEFIFFVKKSFDYSKFFGFFMTIQNHAWLIFMPEKHKKHELSKIL